MARRRLAQRPRGQIHFPGEHCSVDFQGYMEGGAAEGIRAAKEVLAAIRHKPRRGSTMVPPRRG